MRRWQHAAAIAARGASAAHVRYRALPRARPRQGLGPHLPDAALPGLRRVLRPQRHSAGPGGLGGVHAGLRLLGGRRHRRGMPARGATAPADPAVLADHEPRGATAPTAPLVAAAVVDRAGHEDEQLGAQRHRLARHGHAPAVRGLPGALCPPAGAATRAAAFATATFAAARAAALATAAFASAVAAAPAAVLTPNLPRSPSGEQAAARAAEAREIHHAVQA